MRYHKLTGLLLLCLGFSCSKLFACEKGSSRVISEIHFLAEENFTLDRLTACFYAVEDANDAEGAEMFLTWTADSRLIGPYSPSLQLPVSTKEPLMFQFKIGENVFFLHRNRKGNVRWETISGENIFEREIGSRRVFYGGQHFARSGGTPPDRPNRRGLTLVVERLGSMTSEELQQLVQFYDSRLQFPSSLTLVLVDSFEEAHFRNESIPPLLVPDGVTLTMGSGHDVDVTYFRRSDGRRDIHIYHDGKPVLVETLSSTEQIGSLNLPNP